MARFLIVLGLALLVAGLLWPFLSRIGLGRLPGDIVIERENMTFYFPLMTCLLLSVVLSLVFWVVNRRDGDRAIAPGAALPASFCHGKRSLSASETTQASVHPAFHAGALPRSRCHSACTGRRGFLR